MTVQLTIEQVGRRLYVRGNSYPVKDTLRTAGAKWDADQRAWYVGTAKRAQLEALVSGGIQAPDRDRPQGLDIAVRGKASYKGKTYPYITAWAGERDGQYMERVLLVFRDGSSQFWAPSGHGPEQAQITKIYREPLTLRKLQELADGYRNMSDDERWTRERIRDAGGACRCAKPLDEGDGECMLCGYAIVD